MGSLGPLRTLAVIAPHFIYDRLAGLVGDACGLEACGAYSKVTRWHRDRDLSVKGISTGHMATLVLQRYLRTSRGRLTQVVSREP